MTKQQNALVTMHTRMTSYINTRFPADKREGELTKIIDHLEQIREEMRQPVINLDGIEDEPADMYIID